MRDRMLTPAELAEELQVSERTLETWRYRGTGPAYLRMGKYVRYQRVDVDIWLTSQRKATA